ARRRIEVHQQPRQRRIEVKGVGAAAVGPTPHRRRSKQDLPRGDGDHETALPNTEHSRPLAPVPASMMSNSSRSSTPKDGSSTTAGTVAPCDVSASSSIVRFVENMVSPLRRTRTSTGPDVD